jgi:hypothetical protein
MDAYIYRADIYCAPCGEYIISMVDPKKRESGDSNDYPQGPYANGGGDADTIQYCGHCHIDLGNPVIGGRWFDEYGNVLRTIPAEAVEACTQPGKDADGEVQYWIEALNFDGDADMIRAYLRECGAWDDTELMDWRQNLARLFWIYCGDLREDPDAYLSLQH